MTFEPRTPQPVSPPGKDLLGWTAILLSGASCAAAATAVLFTPSNPWITLCLAAGAMACAVTCVRILVWPRVAPRAVNPRGDRDPVRAFGARPLDSLVAVLRVSRAVGANTPLAELSQIVVDACLDCFNCDEASLMMLEPAKRELRVTAFAGHRQPLLVRNARVPLGESVAGMVAMSGKPMILGPKIDTESFPGFRDKVRSIASSMSVPVTWRGKLVGVLNVSTGNMATPFQEDDLRVLCLLAEHTGIAVAKSRDSERITRIMLRVRRQRARRDPERTHRAA